MSGAADPAFWSTRRVLVTGASGMVGSWLARWLVDAGANVAAIVCDHEPDSEFVHGGLAERVSVVNGRLEDFNAQAVAGGYGCAPLVKSPYAVTCDDVVFEIALRRLRRHIENTSVF